MEMNTTYRSLADDKNVLVTGGAGFIGCALSQRLAPRARRYIVMDNLHPQVHCVQARPSALHANAELMVADVTETASWETLFDDFRPQIVIHLAAETGTGQSLLEASRHALVNVVGVTRLTDALARYRLTLDHLLLTSSRAVYGEGAWRANDGSVVYPGQRDRAQLEAAQWTFPGMKALPSRADRTQPHPTSIYGVTKLAQEHVLHAWALAAKVPLTILRLQNVYGPGQSLTNSYTGIVALFSRFAQARRVIPLYEDGEVIRDFVNIEDVADAVIAALARRPQPVSIFDIGSGSASSIAAMAKMIASYHDAPEPVVNGAFRDGDVRHSTCDLDITQRELRWRPRWELRRGLAEFQRWIALQLQEA